MNGFRNMKWLVHLQEKAMAAHSSTLAWKIPWTEEPGKLQSIGSRRVGHDWATSISLSTFLHWRRKWQPTPVFLPGESQGRGNLVGCHLWGCTESDMSDVTWQAVAAAVCPLDQMIPAEIIFVLHITRLVLCALSGTRRAVCLLMWILFWAG